MRMALLATLDSSLGDSVVRPDWAEIAAIVGVSDCDMVNYYRWLVARAL
jgi:hypothetical protein